MRFCPHCCFKDKIDNARFATQEAAKQTTSSLLSSLHEGNAGRIGFSLTSQLCIAVQAALQRWTAMLSIDVTLPKNSSNADC